MSVSQGVFNLQDVLGLIRAVRDYTDFSEDNDPTESMTFGSLEWKVKDFLEDRLLRSRIQKSGPILSVMKWNGYSPFISQRSTKLLFLVLGVTENHPNQINDSGE